jgi:ankyrin repeat protein
VIEKKGATGLPQPTCSQYLHPFLRAQFGDTPLHYAAFCGHADMVAVLLDAGADAARVSSDGRTALATAIEERHVAVARMLADALSTECDLEDALPECVDARYVGADSDASASLAAGSPLATTAGSRPASSSAATSWSRGRGKEDSLELEDGDGHASSNRRGVTLLCDAVQAGDVKRALELLAVNVDVNGVDHDGFTALHRAAVTGNISLCDALLAHGADPNARDTVSTPSAVHFCLSFSFHVTLEPA